MEFIQLVQRPAFLSKGLNRGNVPHNPSGRHGRTEGDAPPILVTPFGDEGIRKLVLRALNENQRLI